MEIKIEGTVSINTAAADAIQLISNEATFNELMHILITRPEVLTAAANEAADRADAVKEAKLRKSYGDDYELIVGHPHIEKGCGLQTGWCAEENEKIFLRHFFFGL